MSTIIYDAYKYDGNLQSLMDELPRVRIDFHKHIESNLKSLFNDEIMDADNAYQSVKNMAKSDMRWIQEYEDTCIQVYVCEDIIYIQLFGMIKSIHIHDDLIKKLYDFSFDDRCMDDSEKDWWKSREKIWGKIFHKSPIPLYAGLSYSIGDSNIMLLDTIRKIRGEKPIYGYG